MTRHAPERIQALPLAGTNAIVTGAGRGLGAAISRRLAEAGARLVLVGRDAATLDSHAATLGGDPVVIPADLSEPGSPAAVITAACQAVGRIDILVNNAGQSFNAPSSEITGEDFDTHFAVNVRAPFLLAGSVAGLMAESGGGAIVNLSSAIAGAGIPGTSLYAAGKGALEASTRALAGEWGMRGVRVNAIRPAVTRSDMSAPLLADPGFRGRYLPQVALADIGEASDIAATVQFLVSDEGAYITGQVLDVDGGWSVLAPPLF